MSKMIKKLTDNQVRRLKYSITYGCLIPRDIRKKLYFCVKSDLKVFDGITESILNEINKYIDISKINKDILSICFPKYEISLESYWDFIGEKPDSDYDENKFDEFNIHGYKNRVLFLQYLIDKL